MKRLLFFLLFPLCLCASILDAPPYRPPFQFASSGLVLSVPAGTFADATGGIQAYAGGSLTLVPSYTNHVYLLGNQLVGFSRAIHRGGVYLGYAITGGSSVTATWQPKEFKPLPSRIGRFLAGQKLGLPQKVAAVGDSITQGAQASGNLGFANILFSTTYSSAGRNVLNAANITLSPLGQSGASVEWGLAFTGEMVSRPYTGVGQFMQTGMHRTRYNNTLHSVIDTKKVGTAAHLKTRYDLATVGFGNASSWNVDLSAAHLETIIQRLRELGTEVVLHTEQPFYNGSGGSINNWAVLRDAKRMQDIADAQCCELVDTFGAMQWLHDAGLESTYYNPDHTHPNTLGHDWWAMLFASVVDPRYAKVAESYPARRSQYPLGVYGSGYGSGVDVCFEYTGTGTVGADPNAATFGAPNLNTLATGADSTHNAYLLSAGQKINIGHGGITGLGVITGLPSGSSATCHMADQSGNTWGSSFIISGSFGDQVTKIFQLGDFLGFTGGLANWYEGANSPSRLPCYAIDMWLIVDSFTGTETQLPVVCPVFETPRRIEIGTFQQVGTWSTDTGAGHENCPVPYTDTAGSSAVVPFSTDVLEVWIVVGSQVGFLDAFVDGEQVITNARLGPISNAGYVYHLYLQPGNSPGNHTAQAGYRTARTSPHYAVIKLRSTGGSIQLETATAAGTVTSDGNATVVVTGAGISGSPVSVSVPVLNGDTASVWAGKVRTALLGTSAITALYGVGGSGTSIILQRNTTAANDGTLNISLDNGTCTGITTASTSANSSAGAASAPTSGNRNLQIISVNGLNFE